MNLVAEAARRAARFLAGKQGDSGNFSDFLVFNTPGTEWITGYVGLELITSDSCETARAALAAADYLRRVERPGGGWGYHAIAPVDADSISWCSRFLAAFGDRGRRASEATWEVLRQHFEPVTRGFRTYLPRTGVLNIGSGYTQPSPCVTANAALALVARGRAEDREMVAAAVANVLAEQLPCGAWASYWWAGLSYPTFWCSYLLSSCKSDPWAVDRALNWLRETRVESEGWNGDHSGGSRPFSTALGIKTLCLTDEPADDLALEEAVGWLVGQQLQDGSWVNPPVMRVPGFAVARRWSPTDAEPVLPALERVFTTANSLGALCGFLRRRRSRQM